LEKPLVLVADDNDATATLIQALLRADFLVDRVADGQEAVHRLRNREYSAVLLDLLMPVADGYVVLDFLSQERPDVLERVLVVTAALSSREMDRLRGYRIRGVIAKPFEVETLQREVRRCTGIDGDESPLRPLFSSGMILLLADLLRQRLG